MTAPLSSLALQILDRIPSDGTSTRAKQIAQATGQPKKLVQRILAELHEDGIVRTGGKGWWTRA